MDSVTLRYLIAKSGLFHQNFQYGIVWKSSVCFRSQGKQMAMLLTPRGTSQSRLWTVSFISYISITVINHCSNTFRGQPFFSPLPDQNHSPRNPGEIFLLWDGMYKLSSPCIFGALSRLPGLASPNAWSGYKPETRLQTHLVPLECSFGLLQSPWVPGSIQAPIHFKPFASAGNIPPPACPMASPLYSGVS